MGAEQERCHGPRWGGRCPFPWRPPRCRGERLSVSLDTLGPSSPWRQERRLQLRRAGVLDVAAPLRGCGTRFCPALRRVCGRGDRRCARPELTAVPSARRCSVTATPDTAGASRPTGGPSAARPWPTRRPGARVGLRARPAPATDHRRVLWVWPDLRVVPRGPRGVVVGVTGQRRSRQQGELFKTALPRASALAPGGSLIQDAGFFRNGHRDCSQQWKLPHVSFGEKRKMFWFYM